LKGLRGVLWYIGYGVEIAAMDIYYLDLFWGYYTSSFEQRAQDYAGQTPYPTPDPWWQPYWDYYYDSVWYYID